MMFFNGGDQAAVSLLTGVLCARRRGRVLITFLTFVHGMLLHFYGRSCLGRQ